MKSNAERGKVSDFGREVCAYQFSFCVSFAICNSFPSFSIDRAKSVFALMELVRWVRTPMAGGKPEENIPKSLMLKTPGTLELARRLAPLSSAGLDDRPWTAESTVDKGAGAASADMMDEGGFTRNLGGRCKGRLC